MTERDEYLEQGETPGVRMEHMPPSATRFFESARKMMPEELARTVDEQLRQIPPGALVGLSLASMGLAGTLAFTRRRKGWATFVGVWAPTFLFLALYAKFTKLEPTLH